MLPVVGADLSKRLVPDELWEPAAPLLPSFAARPQGSGIAPCDERAVFTAVVYALTSGCAWRHLPPPLGTSPATAHRRFTVWTEAGLRRRLHRAVLDELGARGEVDSTSAIVDAASVRAKKGGSLTGPNPVDRGRRAASCTCWVAARRTGGRGSPVPEPEPPEEFADLRHWSCLPGCDGEPSREAGTTSPNSRAPRPWVSGARVDATLPSERRLRV
ncbi:transposase [Streptomyces sp. NPDC002054]|uniref:transposase n=1 Tax=Streptomyces sp. NPDC002054 TaxID=3154663 RepID=UPI0033168066